MAFREDKNGIIRDELGRYVPGQSGNPAGAKPRSQTEEAREAVEPFLGSAIEQLERAVAEGKPWAILETLNRSWGKATDRVDLTSRAPDEIVLTLPRPSDVSIGADNGNGTDSTEGK